MSSGTDTENGIPLDTAAVVSTVLEGILYGISIMMFIGTVWSLTYRRSPSRVNTAMIVVACLMLVFSTAHMVVDIIRIYEGLVEYRNTFYDGPIGFFNDASQWSFVYKNLIYSLQTLVGDGVVIYRCYVVWESWWIIIFPVILWASVAVAGVGCVYFDSQANPTQDVFTGLTGKWITAFLVVALCTNVFSTALLAFRIWRLGRRVMGASRSTVLLPVLRILLDSGVLYSVTLLAMLMCFVASNRGHYILLDMTVPIVSITFYMVIIRTTLTQSVSPDLGQPSSGESGRLTFVPRYNRESEYQMKGMEVHITRLTETNEDYARGSGGRGKDRGTEAGVSPPAKYLDSFAI